LAPAIVRRSVCTAASVEEPSRGECTRGHRHPRASRAAIRILCGALAWANLACDGVAACLDRGGSFNHQIGQCDLERTQPGPASPCLHDILGRWRVADQRAPGISKVSAEEANGWTNRRATYRLHRVVFDNDLCGDPTYVSRVIAPAAFASEFHVEPADLGLPSADT